MSTENGFSAFGSGDGYDGVLREDGRQSSDRGKRGDYRTFKRLNRNVDDRMERNPSRKKSNLRV
jgi:hypothetical protein